MNMASIGIVLFILTVICFCAGKANKAFVSVQSKTEHVGQTGQKSLLECVVETAQNIVDARILVVTWKKDDAKEALLVFNRGNLTHQPGYSFAEPSWDVRNMNVSLLIANTVVQDMGVYTCWVMTDSGFSSNRTTLKVKAQYSTPTISSKPEKMTPNTDATLMCNSEGGFPEGQLRWFDEHNADWTKSAVMQVKKTENGLFHLSSELSLRRGSIFSAYTCVVFNASGGKEAEATFQVPDVPNLSGHEQVKGLDTATKIVAPVVVIGSLIAGLLMVLLFYRRRTQQARRLSAAPLMGDHGPVHTCESETENHQELCPEYKDSLA